MKRNRIPKTFGTGKSVVVRRCQVCDSKDLQEVLFVGYLPPVNQMPRAGSFPQEETSYPALLLSCRQCHLVQLGLIVDPQILFPPQYPYTSSTTKILRDNFFQLFQECQRRFALKRDDLIVDIGSNDGNLLWNFKDCCRIVGVTPEDIGSLAVRRGIPTIFSFFNDGAVKEILQKYGKAKIVTATNVFAHMEDIHGVLSNVRRLLRPDGVFISESHYLISLIQNLQYDTIYHEHLRYYSLTSLNFLLRSQGLVIFDVQFLPTHGGSIRVYSGRPGRYPVLSRVQKVLDRENVLLKDPKFFGDFKRKVVLSQLKLCRLLFKLKAQGRRIFGISAPSRATTLIHFTGIREGILECIVEIKGSQKIGHYLPGTLIPIHEESILYKDQPDYALILSWHIAQELMPKLKQNGFKGDFIVPLPNPKIFANLDV